MAVTVGVTSVVGLTITAEADFRLGVKEDRVRAAKGVMSGVNDLELGVL